MNIYAMLALCASAISISLGVSVYFLNRKTLVNRIFLATMAANGYWAFCQFMISQSAVQADAALWSKALSAWPFLIALMLHFTLAFTDSNLLKHKTVYLLLYFPALLFSIIDLTTNWISLAPQLKPWGYETTISPTVFARLDGIWAAILCLLMLFLFTTYYRRTHDATRKKQTLFITIAFSFPIMLSIVFDSIFQAMELNIPTLGHISGSFAAFFVLYAMSKYGLFSVTPEIAAENVFSAMPDSVILTNLEGIIVRVNPPLLAVSGYREEEIVGKSIGQMLQKAAVVDSANTAPKVLEQLRRQREIRGYEISLYSRSGEKKFATISSSMIVNNLGEDVGYAFILHDLTDRKEMEQKLIKAERLASIGELAGILGHDLRNPLFALRGASFYLKRKYADVLDEEDKAIFENIDKSINYSDKIITDLVDYSSEINLELKTSTPAALIKGALALVSAPQKMSVIDNTQESPELRVDAEKVSRNFANIIKNAFDAMPNGGELTLSSETVEGNAVFTFTDNGQGMSPETLSKLWHPLFTTKAKGMGFGLPNCKRIVEAHGGKIIAESTLGQGTTIKVTLPLK